jgi:protein-S-isoprenylcysteine O-methyltransferase Ste14
MCVILDFTTRVQIAMDGQMSQPDPGDTADVVARPPVIYLVSILLGVGACSLWRVQVIPPTVSVPLGVLFACIAALLFVLSIRELRRAGTPIPTNQPTTALVTSGPYRLSRNPIYLAFTFLQLGVGLWMNCLWIIVLLAPTIALMTWGVIMREERYLTQKFGAEYLNYKKSAGRWL